MVSRIRATLQARNGINAPPGDCSPDIFITNEDSDISFFSLLILEKPSCRFSLNRLMLQAKFSVQQLFEIPPSYGRVIHELEFQNIYTRRGKPLKARSPIKEDVAEN